MATEAVEQEFTEAELDGGEEAPVTETVVPPAETPPTVTEPAAPKVETTPPVTPPVVVPPETPPEAKTVPLAALHEARRENRELRVRLDALEKKAAEGPSPKTASELAAEDPEGAAVLLEQQIEDLRNEITRREIEQGIHAEVPDFLEKAPKMEELLLDSGISEDTAKNLIAASGRDVPKFFKLLSRLVDMPDAKAQREALVKEMTPIITAQVTKDLMAKFNVTTPAKNIGKLPGALDTGQIVATGEDEFSKLTPDQQKIWLDGG